MLTEIISKVERIAVALERIADILDRAYDEQKCAIRMRDVDRADVYKEHLGKKLR